MQARTLHALFFCVVLIMKEFSGAAISAQVDVKPGPVSGVVVKEAPGLLMTERKLVSQTIFVELDPEKAIAKNLDLPSVEDNPDFRGWYNNHILRTRESTKEILRQLEKTFVHQNQLPSNRPKRFIGLLIGAIVMAVIGAVVGTTMSIANSVTVDTLNAKCEDLRHSLAQIQVRLDNQDLINEDLMNIVNQTVVVQNGHGVAIEKLTRLSEKYWYSQTLYYSLVDPVQYVTQDFLREVQFNIGNLIKGNIPLYFVTTEDVKQILGQLHHVVVDEMQIRVALEMGTAIPMFIDVDKLQLSFLLNLPLVLPEKIYMTKQVLNVGSWKGETYLKVKTPPIVAYQPWNDGTYLVPNLDTCVVFKDLNYLCPGKPFVPEFSNIGCGVTDGEGSLSTCEVTVSQPDPFSFNTMAVLMDKRWLVSTSRENMTVTYAVHGTYKVVPLEHRVSLITVPKDVIVTIGSQALFYVSGEEIVEEIQLINVFNSQKFKLDSDLEWLLQNKQNHTLRFAIRKSNVTIDKYLYDNKDMSLFKERDWMAIKVYGLTICICLMGVWMAVISFLVYLNTKNRKGSWIRKNKNLIQEHPILSKTRIVCDETDF